jgi:hypothetical protein
MNDESISRRDFFSWSTRGLGATALAQLLLRDGMLARADEPAASSGTHFAGRAKRVIHISLIGGLSHLDSFDYKPALADHHGQTLTTDEKPDTFFGQIGLLRKEDFPFRQRGQSGLWISDLFPQIAALADELTIIRSMTADSANHTPALYFENSGFQFSGFPSVGSWVTYGLGTESDELPAYVVLPDVRGLPNGGASIWSSGFLPAEHQGVLFQAGPVPVRDLLPAHDVSPDTERAVRSFLREADAEYQQRLGGDGLLAARIRSYELAARMQLAAPDVSSLDQESAATRSLYGLDQTVTQDFGRNCLLARRLVERGVRFVQIFSGGPIAGSPRASWDAHENVRENHGAEAARIDRPVAALVQDLKQRGLLKDTLVLFTTEFGRTPFAQSAADAVGPGRDHNRYGFSVWMAGAGLRPGIAFGSTDEVGWKAAEHPVPWHDFHATLLHLLGIDHQRLTHYHNGIQRRLTNVHGEVVQGLLS